MGCENKNNKLLTIHERFKNCSECNIEDCKENLTQYQFMRILKKTYDLYLGEKNDRD